MLDLLKVIYTHTTKVTLWSLLLSDAGAMTPRLGLGCHVTFVYEPGIQYSDIFLPKQIDREIAGNVTSEVFHVCSCCCKAVAGRIVCWQFRQAITRDSTPTLIIPSSLSSKTLEASTYRQPFEKW